MEEILGKARAVFVRCGLRSVTMDDVCREMGISKKTLYRYVSDKPDLIVKTVEREIVEDKELIGQILEKNLNAIDELYEITKHVSERLKHLHPVTVFEMQKYYPEAWAILKKYRNEFVVRVFHDNIIKGQNEGLYREDIRVAIVACLYGVCIDLLAELGRDPRQDINTAAVFYETFKYHIRGIANATGILYLEEKLTQIPS